MEDGRRQDQKTERSAHAEVDITCKARKSLEYAASRTQMLIYWAERNTRTFQKLLDIESEPTAIPGELRRHLGLPLQCGTWGLGNKEGPGQVQFSVCPL